MGLAGISREPCSCSIFLRFARFLEDHVAADNFWGKFRRWRRHRPFWGGLFLILSAIELFLSANMSIGGLEVHLGPQGFLSYLLPLLLLMCGLLAWFTPAQRLFYGIVALLAALYTFVGLNLGGFIIGMLLGILGGALLIAWGPPRPQSGTGKSGPPAGEPTDHDEDLPQDVGDDIFGQHPQDIDETQQIPVAGHDDRPHEQPSRPPAQRSAFERLSRNPRAIAVAVVPLAVTATILVVGSTLPASAEEECPKGMPSRSVAATSAPASRAVAKKKAPATTVVPAAPKKTTAAPKETTAAPATSAPAATDDNGNPIVDGFNDFIDGVGNLLGINGEESPSPSESPSPPESPDPTTAPTTAAPTSPETSAPATSAPATSATPTKAASPSASSDDIPCLGPRVLGKVAGADDIPIVAKKPGLMEVGTLTMYNSTYDGVVDMPTAGGGSFKALKFSMDKATNKPFSLTIDEPTGGTTLITSAELTTDQNVRFYTPRFEGKLFGLIPVIFTPDSPPPLTLPVLWFTDVTIQLAYVRCDTLTGDPLKVQGKA
jgi:hypothetical protein